MKVALSLQILTMVLVRDQSFFTIILRSFTKIFFSQHDRENNITTVIHMGDAFDGRKSIDYQSLEWAKRVVFDPLNHIMFI